MVAEHQRVREVEVERDQATPFVSARLDQRPVRRARHRLLDHCRDIVTGVAQQIRASGTEVFVELDLQAECFRGTSTYRSRDISAP